MQLVKVGPVLMCTRVAFTPQSADQGHDGGPCFCYIVHICSCCSGFHTMNGITDFTRQTQHHVIIHYVGYLSLIGRLAGRLLTSVTVWWGDPHIPNVNTFTGLLLPAPSNSWTNHSTNRNLSLLTTTKWPCICSKSRRHYFAKFNTKTSQAYQCEHSLGSSPCSKHAHLERASYPTGLHTTWIITQGKWHKSSLAPTLALHKPKNSPPFCLYKGGIVSVDDRSCCKLLQGVYEDNL